MSKHIFTKIFVILVLLVAILPSFPAAGAGEQAPRGSGDMAVDYTMGNPALNFQAVGSAYTFLRNQNSDKCIEVVSGSTAEGANVQQWMCHRPALPFQLWQLADVGGGYYNVKALHSGKCITVAGASTANGANVVQATCNGGNNQKLSFQPVGNGYYKAVFAHSNKCLDVSGGSLVDGGNIQQWPCNGATAQSFYRPPKGVLDWADYDSRAVGWACDADSYPTALTVKFYMDGPSDSGVYLGSTTANVDGGSFAAAQCGGSAAHLFYFTLPASVRNGQKHTIYAYAINYPDAGRATILDGSPYPVKPLQWFGYYHGNTGGGNGAGEFSDHTNLVHVYANTASIIDARNRGLKAIVDTSGFFFVNSGGNCYRRDTNTSDWNNFASAVLSQGLQNTIVGFFNFDEPDQHCLNNADVEWSAQIIKATFPNKKLLVVYGYSAVMVSSFQTPNYHDWISFDRYGDFQSKAIAYIFTKLKSKLKAGQKIFLTADGVSFNGVPSQSGQQAWVTRAQQYYDLARANPDSVRAIVTFLWPSVNDGMGNNLTGVRDMQYVKAKWRLIGGEIIH